VADKNDQLLAIPSTTTPPATPPTTPPSTPPATPPATTVATTTSLTAGGVVYRRRRLPNVILTVAVTPNSGTVQPGGTVELMYNGSVLGTGTLQIVNGVAVAQFTVQFPASGSYTFSAQYMGSTSFLGSSSNSVTVIV